MALYIAPPKEFVPEPGIPPFPGWYPASICGATEYLRYWDGEAFHFGCSARWKAQKIVPEDPKLRPLIEWMKPWWLPTGTKNWQRYYEAMQLGIPEKYARLIAKNWGDRYEDLFESAESMIYGGFRWSASQQGHDFWLKAFDGDYTMPIKEEWLK